MSDGMEAAPTEAVFIAVESKIEVDTEHEDAEKVGRSLGPREQSSQHLNGCQLGGHLARQGFAYSLTDSPQLFVIFTHCCCGQSLLAGVPTTTVAKRYKSKR